MRHFIIGFLALGSMLAFSHRAAADDTAAAKDLFDKGLADMQEGKYEVGCKELAESVRLDRKPGALFTLATCEFQRGRLATALARYEEFLRMYDQMADSDKPRQEARVEDTRKKRDQLMIDVPRWTIALRTNAPKGVEVKGNGETIGEAMLGVAVPVDPGEYVLTTRVPGGPLKERRINIAPGARLRITLDVELPPAVKTPPVPSVLPDNLDVLPSPMHPRRVTGGVFLGIGGALLATGVIAGGIAMSNKGTAGEHCGGPVGFPDNPTTCDDEGKAAGLSAATAATVSTVGFVAGGIGTALGTILILSAPGMITPIKGKTVPPMEIGILSAGPFGAMGGVRGAW